MTDEPRLAHEGTRYTCEPVTASDLAEVIEMIASSGLPLDGVEENLSHFFVVRDAGRVVGVIGAEVYGKQALLRSACVAHSRRGRGLGRALTERLIDYAGTLGASELYLLTTTAEDYFGRLGFRRIDRASVSGPVLESVEFRSACPVSAVVMVLPLK